jgi:AcrR family transcriptional regulator
LNRSIEITCVAVATQRARVQPDRSTPDRLLDATERLIGAQGVDGVSVRAINAAANSNVAATHYHFGSKEALVSAALARRMDALAADRLAMLAPLERRRRPTVRSVVEALVLPLARLCRTAEGRPYVRFLSTLDRAGEPWRGLLADAFAPQWAHLGPVLANALPDLPDAVRQFRFSAAATLLLDVLAGPERHVAGAPLAASREAVVTALIDLITGALSAPASEGRDQ